MGPAGGWLSLFAGAAGSGSHFVAKEPLQRADPLGLSLLS